MASGGGVTNNKRLPLSKLQKTFLRILFGDNEAYLDKFKTSARVRLFEEQKLGAEFFKREHTKPLFTKHFVMNVRNEILKFRISLFEILELSKRNGLKESRLITPEPSLNFTYQAALIWNVVREVLMLGFSKK